jgi:hypothetical protein
MNDDLIWRYRFFRKVEACRAIDAMRLARAEQEAERLGWTWCTEEEQEQYRDVYGDDPEPGVEYLRIVARDEDGWLIDSLGFCDGTRDYFRFVAAELFSGALATTHLPGDST